MWHQLIIVCPSKQSRQKNHESVNDSIKSTNT